MINFSKFVQYTGHNTIKIVNTEINKIIESYIFLLIEQELSSSKYDHCVQNIIKSKQVIIDYYQNYNTKPMDCYFIIGFQNTIIIINFVTGYTTRVPPNNNELFMPKTWTIFGSNDENKWEILDSKENNNEINSENRCVYFEINDTGKFYKYIKYEQVGFFIAFAAIEFFGYIMK